MAKYIGAYIKFVEKECYVDDLLDGNLYFNPWVYFERIENSQRTDKIETAFSIITRDFQIPFSTNRIRYQIILKDKDNWYAPVFCLYSYFTKRGIIPSRIMLKDEKLHEFGKFAVVIFDVEKFLKQVKTNLLGFSMNYVQYLDFNDARENNVLSFRNPIIQKEKRFFSHQQEMRF